MVHLPKSPISQCSLALRTAALLVAATACVHATAQTGAVPGNAEAAGTAAAATPSSSSSQWGLGIGVGMSQLPYAGADNKNRALPLLYYENSWVRVLGGTADFKVANWPLGAAGSVALDARLKYDDAGYKPGDSPALTGMDERKGGLWGGGALTWHHPMVRASAAWTADLSGHSKGQKLELQLDRRFGFGNFALTPRVQAQWADKKYVDYYYGVQAHEALPQRAQYTGKAATTLELGVRLDYRIQPRQTVFLDMSATSLPDEIKRSPIVGRSSASRVAVGYLYRF